MSAGSKWSAEICAKGDSCRISFVPRLCGLFALFSFAAPAQAYWEYGHETVARIAWLQMRPDTRAKVAALLRQGRLLETPGLPGGDA